MATSPCLLELAGIAVNDSQLEERVHIIGFRHQDPFVDLAGPLVIPLFLQLGTDLQEYLL
jgi:hypothetical protein